ncbi:protein of unknown function DUF45 [Anaerovibrio sp. JC8]|uniref:M48 family metallopeptidase n=1 Tax=Anaerovibrio sp. JC8 TaxID=1240085 RepID=UPI000A0DA520|nr:M48 family metallopeptidase [Anaerovibrio sp. JC8]ORT99875.1 protein of unknown function DUF45 [Anaerovibrio sp. JC8]
MIKARATLPEGYDMPFRGKAYKLKITSTLDKPTVQIRGDSLTVNFYTPHPKVPVQVPLVRWYRNRAKEYLPQRAAFWAEQMGVRYNKIIIKDQESRWGSCSSLKNINLNWRIMMAPDDVIDYLVIHELAHLQEMNHSIRFWRLVGRFDQHFKLHTKWLKENGRELFLILPKLPVSILNKVTFYC